MKTLDIPFSGFYESLHDYELNLDMENFCENYADENGLKLADVCEAAWDATDWRATHNSVAKEYARVFCGSLDDLGGWKLGLRFSELASPREYNFSTDRIEASVSRSTARRMRKECDISKIDAIARDRHTSCSGFHSFYSADWRSWGSVDTWDHVQLSTLLLAWIESHGFDEHAQTLQDEARDYMSGNSGYECAINMEKFAAHFECVTDEERSNGPLIK